MVGVQYMICHQAINRTDLSQTSFGHISINSHGLNGYGKPLKRPFDRYQSRFEAINNGQDIRQINW